MIANRKRARAPSANTRQVKPRLQQQQAPPVVAPPVVAPPVAHVAPVVPPPAPNTVRVRIGENGKVHYFGRDSAADRATHNAAYFSVPVGTFATWKGAGKRHESNKWTDPVSGQNYVQHNGVFHHFDRTQPNNVGAQAAVQPNQANLVNRTRGNRVTSPLAPFDVGPYRTNVVLGGRTYTKLPTAKGRWPANNDHSTSGQSLRQRNVGGNATAAYQTGITIAIDNPTMHRVHSPTYGGRQGTFDTLPGGGTMRRVQYDAANPGSAFMRDAFHMLDNTANVNASAVPNRPAQPTLDMTQPNNRLRQMGAYRTMYRTNTRMNQHFPTRGVDPTVAGRTFVHNPGAGTVGTFTYAHAPNNESQGQLIAAGFRQRLVNEGHAGP